MTTISTAVLRWGRSDPERLAVVYEDQRIRYAELAARVRHTAAGLRAQGIARGDIVALLMKNSPAFVELMLAISHLGAVSLPINYRLNSEEVAYILEHAGAKLLLADEEFATGQPPCRCIVVDSAAQSDSRRLSRVDAAQRAETFDACLVQPGDTFRLMYTSGTTDRPKGVVHTYDNYTWKCLDHICVLGLSAADRLLVAGPLYHVGAFDLPGMALLLVGGAIVILRDFDAERALDAIAHERITGAWFAPIMLNRLLLHPNRDRYDVRSLRWVIGGGEKTPAERIRAFQSLFVNGRYIDGYGLTESCSGDTLMEAGFELEKIGSAGRPMPHVHVRICDAEGRALPTGETGEICLHGPKITQGYWRDPQRTAASFFGPWFRSGDMGYLDADGFLFLVDRKKDMVVSGGENVASSEVERVIYQLDCIEEAAVIGLPDAQWGERVVAVVALRPGTTLTLDALQTHCRSQLGGFKVPRQLVRMDALPRNPSGKVLKRVLRDELAATM